MKSPVSLLVIVGCMLTQVVSVCVYPPALTTRDGGFVIRKAGASTSTCYNITVSPTDATTGSLFISSFSRFRDTVRIYNSQGSLLSVYPKFCSRCPLHYSVLETFAGGVHLDIEARDSSTLAVGSYTSNGDGLSSLKIYGTASGNITTWEMDNTNSTYQQYLIAVSGASAIDITFTSLSSDGGSVVRVQRGAFIDGNVLQTVSSVPSTFSFPIAVALVTLTSSLTPSTPGFSLHYQASFHSSSSDDRQVFGTACGSGVTYANISGGFYARRGSHTYPTRGGLCQWLIVAPHQSTEVRIRFTELSITSLDSVSVYEGTSVDSGTLVAEYDSQAPPPELSVSGRFALVTFFVGYRVPEEDGSVSPGIGWVLVFSSCHSSVCSSYPAPPVQLQRPSRPLIVLAWTVPIGGVLVVVTIVIILKKWLNGRAKRKLAKKKKKKEKHSRSDKTHHLSLPRIRDPDPVRPAPAITPNPVYGQKKKAQRTTREDVRPVDPMMMDWYPPSGQAPNPDFVIPPPRWDPYPQQP